MPCTLRRSEREELRRRVMKVIKPNEGRKMVEWEIRQMVLMNKRR